MSNFDSKRGGFSDYQRRGNAQQQQAVETWTGGNIPQDEIETKVTDETVKFAEKFGQYLAKGGNKLTTSQLRRFFGEVRRIQMVGYEDAKSDFILLSPKLAYAVGRAKDKNKNSKIADFYIVISNGISRVKDEQSFKNFIKIFEAIVAYHKQYEKQ